MFTENLTAFFADFGVPATLGGSAVVGVFDNEHTVVPAGGFGMSSTQPRLTLPTAQVPADAIGQAVAVAGGAYVVVEHIPDGTGISVLNLEAAA